MFLAALRRRRYGASAWFSSHRFAALAAVGGAAVGLCALAARRTALRRALGWVGVTGAVTAAAIEANIYSGFVPTRQAVRVVVGGLPFVAARSWVTDSGSTVSPHVIPANPAYRVPRTTTWVYTPAGFDPRGSERYPVLYVLHGSPGGSSDWFAGGDLAATLDSLIASRRIPPLIAVAPSTNGRGLGKWDTEGLDSTNGGSLIESHLVNDVVPWVDRMFPTAAGPMSRAIVGMSAGAFAALNIGLRNRRLFDAIGVLEGYPDAGLAGHLLLRNRAQRDANTPALYLSRNSESVAMRVAIVMAQSSSASRRRDMDTVASLLVGRGAVVDQKIACGHNHTWVMARESVGKALAFLYA
ncbi:alpha/beta hydrolase [Rarobacter incanus]|uniref:Putative esterase n=1 Tax=Rarobacter incanus TaxID=153494 RepID=A0A542SQM0_9MICO|nr:alpha/beta hydrolase-fold protein [Rarobacter incanus]TQK76902.1 putative esterase [Rarobacter incanus]